MASVTFYLEENLLLNTNEKYGTFWSTKSKIAGGLVRVEKVKPDPLNLLVNTDVGSNKHRFQMKGSFRAFLHKKSLFCMLTSIPNGGLQ